jgi:hypothetical protein
MPAEAVEGNIRFTTSKGEFTVAIDTIKNAIAFERRFNVSATVLAIQPRLEWLAFMAWQAGRDKGLPVGDDFDAFVDSLVSIESVETETDEGANPTNGDQ